MARHGGRPAWLPAHLVWLPLVLVGLWFSLGLHFDADSAGSGQSRVRITVPGEAGWFAAPSNWVGVGLVALGLLAAGFAAWWPDPRRILVVWRYAPWAYAAILFLLAAGLARWSTEGWLWEGAGDRLSVRFIAIERTGIINLITVWGSLGAGLLCYAFSFGRTPLPQRPTATLEGGQRARPRTSATTTRSVAKPSKTQATGVATHKAVRSRNSNAEGGTNPS